jgi:ABC-type multidrug transport system ATPase subunit
MADAPAIQLQDVSKSFGRFSALRKVTANFQSQRLYAVLGENGAGKSTLLRLVAGLSRPTQGSVLIFGQPPAEARARVGYMAHASMLYDEMTAMENLRYFAALYGEVDDQRLRELLKLVGLDPDLDRRVGDYSQGMRQRASLARAIVHGPEVLLLDEPFSNLDPASSREIAALLAEMKTQKTILVVTHQAALIEKISDEVVMLAAGSLASKGPGLSAFARRPEPEIGSMAVRP